LGPDWQQRYASFELTSAASASLGQVHRATAHDGRALAVKLQYPDMQSAVEADVTQLKVAFAIHARMDPAVETGEIVVVGETHSALTCRQDFPRVKAQARHLAQCAAGGIDKAAPQRAGGILDDRQRAKRPADLVRAGRVPELVDHDRRFRVAGSRLAERFGRAVPFALIDIDEPHLRPSYANSVRRARPTQGGAQHLVSRTDP